MLHKKYITKYSLLLFSCLTLNNLNANASFASASAIIHWDTFSFTPSAGLVIDLSAPSFDRLNIRDLSNGEDDFFGLSSTPSMISHQSIYSNVKSQASPNLIQSSADAYYDSVTSIIERTQEFEVLSGTGYIDISVEGTISSEIGDFNEATLGLNSIATATAAASLMVDFQNPSHFNTFALTELDSIFDSPSVDSRNFTLQLSLNVNAGDIGWYEASTYANAESIEPIPLPSALLFMISGLLGLLGVNRVRKK